MNECARRISALSPIYTQSLYNKYIGTLRLGYLTRNIEKIQL